MHTPGFIGVHAQELGARVVAARSHDPLGRLTCGLKRCTCPEVVRAVHRPDAAPTARSVAESCKTRVTEHGRPLGGTTDSQTPPHPPHAAHARAPRREGDKLAPLWYEQLGLAQASA